MGSICWYTSSRQFLNRCSLEKFMNTKEKMNMRMCFFVIIKPNFNEFMFSFVLLDYTKKKISNKSQYLEHFDEQSNNFVENMSIHK